MKRLIISGTVLLLIILTITGMAFAEVKPGPNLMRGMGVHQEMYMILLSEKYTPEMTNDWKTEFDLRNNLIQELMKLRQEKGGMDRVIQSLDEIKTRLEKLEEKIDDGKIKSEFGKGPGFQGGQPEFGKGLRHPCERFGNYKNQFGKNWGFNMDKNRELFQKFSQAIESGDETQIKAILPELFNQLKDNNQQLEKQIEALKNNNN